MSQPAMLYYVVENQFGLNRGVDTFIVLVSDGETARRAELKIPHAQDPDVFIQQRINQMWNTGQSATMQAYRQAVQRADNPFLASLIDAIYVAISTHATPNAQRVFDAAETVIIGGSPRNDEWVKLTNMYKEMSEDERSRYLGLLTLILLSKTQQT